MADLRSARVAARDPGGGRAGALTRGRALSDVLWLRPFSCPPPPFTPRGGGRCAEGSRVNQVAAAESVRDNPARRTASDGDATVRALAVTEHRVTQLLQRARIGDDQAVADLFPH